jgi:opacity protein-like surface antigen
MVIIEISITNIDSFPGCTQNKMLKKSKETAMFIKVMLSLLGVMLISAIAKAQEIRNPTSIGPHLGWYKAADADDGKVMFGGAIRVKLSNSFGAEGSVDYRAEDYRNESIIVRSWPVMLTGMLYPVENIYGAIGVGWYNSEIDFEKDLDFIDSKSSQEFGWHFGAGVEIPMSERILLNGDFRYTFLNYDFEEVPGSDEISSDIFAITAGLLYIIN